MMGKRETVNCGTISNIRETEGEREKDLGQLMLPSNKKNTRFIETHEKGLPVEESHIKRLYSRTTCFEIPDSIK